MYKLKASWAGYDLFSETFHKFEKAKDRVTELGEEFEKGIPSPVASKKTFIRVLCVDIIHNEKIIYQKDFSKK